MVSAKPPAKPPRAKPKHTPRAQADQAARQARVAKEMRANLQKRKAQQRARREQGEAG